MVALFLDKEELITEPLSPLNNASLLSGLGSSSGSLIASLVEISSMEMDVDGISNSGKNSTSSRSLLTALGDSNRSLELDQPEHIDLNFNPEELIKIRNDK